MQQNISSQVLTTDCSSNRRKDKTKQDKSWQQPCLDNFRCCLKSQCRFAL